MFRHIHNFVLIFVWFLKSNLILCNDVNSWVSQTWASGTKILSGKTQVNCNIEPDQWQKKKIPN
jgi:hypothetical protein